mmetsp:Transcript_72215/g.145295  ORF Transcript_72215/g.145295 Transcript_72215/m.145295 type:complete len:398 (+) Transcript_72215:89-1282(+)
MMSQTAFVILGSLFIAAAFPPTTRAPAVDFFSFRSSQHNLETLGGRVGTSKSQFVGVSWNRKYMRWQAEITVDKKRTFLGYHDCEEAAALAYDKRAARLSRAVNFPNKRQTKAKKRGQDLVVSCYSGVSWHRQSKKWQARISIKGAVKHIGMYEDELEAAIAFDERASLIDAPTNFPVDQKKLKAFKRGESRFAGVHSNKGKWEASDLVHGIRCSIGSFDTEEEAACAYDDHLMATHGASRVNFSIDPSEDYRQALTEPCSKYVGVRRQRQSKRFEAYISIDRKSTFLGIYDNEEGAARAYDGSAASLGRAVNFPAEGQKQARKRGSSRFKGVTWAAREKKWIARINIEGKTQLIGRFENEEDAARAYDSHVLFSDSSKPVNFPPGFNWRGEFYSEL